MPRAIRTHPGPITLFPPSFLLLTRLLSQLFDFFWHSSTVGSIRRNKDKRGRWLSSARYRLGATALYNPRPFHHPLLVPYTPFLSTSVPHPRYFSTFSPSIYKLTSFLARPGLFHLTLTQPPKKSFCPYRCFHLGATGVSSSTPPPPSSLQSSRLASSYQHLSLSPCYFLSPSTSFIFTVFMDLTYDAPASGSSSS